MASLTDCDQMIVLMSENYVYVTHQYVYTTISAQSFIIRRLIMHMQKFSRIYVYFVERKSEGFSFTDQVEYIISLPLLLFEDKNHIQQTYSEIHNFCPSTISANTHSKYYVNRFLDLYFVTLLYYCM